MVQHHKHSCSTHDTNEFESVFVIESFALSTNKVDEATIQYEDVKLSHPTYTLARSGQAMLPDLSGSERAPNNHFQSSDQVVSGRELATWCPPQAARIRQHCLTTAWLVCPQNIPFAMLSKSELRVIDQRLADSVPINKPGLPDTYINMSTPSLSLNLLHNLYRKNSKHIVHCSYYQFCSNHVSPDFQQRA